ncbi:hypothetical protein J2W22_000400 [Sphingomonas kyeonggiensis]|uniref:hypothetical protein n=1 Tax=Sphingomonas kyeonggiensis TaxID=1268553 RepID=UPI002786473A|nr:hypothetical protein [Sphingomonas kyeonggiensis]MDQ0248353.1 hypothetical protein [Sphingomonas kyeonggiensis]
MSERLRSAVSVGVAGALGGWFANFGQLASGTMSALEGLSHSVVVAVIAGGLWYLYDMIWKRADA